MVVRIIIVGLVYLGLELAEYILISPGGKRLFAIIMNKTVIEY